MKLHHLFQPVKVGEGYEIYSLKGKHVPAVNPGSNSNGNSNTLLNPLFKWVISTDNTAVHSFKFSPCGQYLAVVTQVSIFLPKLGYNEKHC